MVLGIYGHPDAFVFPSSRSERHLTVSSANYYFHKILRNTGICDRPHPYSRGKCIHCFRHVFAVKSFAQSEKSGRLLNNSVPYLSVYLGHYDMNGTEKYLKFSSDMLPDIAQNFESYTKDIFPEVPYEIQNK